MLPPGSDGQSAIGDLIAHGITGVKGYIDEPLLQAIASPSIALDRYTRGYTLAESLSAASRFVGWTDLIIGDPLYIIIVMAFWRLVLEAFVVVFRIAEDVRALRERGGR